MLESNTDPANAIGPLNRQSLGELAYERLKLSIVGGQFEPGTKMTVRAIADLLQVSTTPARDAINRLISDGALVTLGPKTIVVPELTLTALEEITKLRLKLEGMAAFESAQHIDDSDISYLESIQEQLNRALDEGKYADVLRLNKIFHFRIYERAKMPRLIAIIESLWLQVGPTFNRLYPDYAITRRGVASHQWAIRGLQDRDSYTVQAAIENDLRDGARRMTQMVRESETSAK